MSDLQRMKTEALTKGTVHVCGEMDIPVNEGPAAAFENANRIAEECGYLARLDHSRLRISGGDITGEYIFDWFHARKCQKIEHWTAQSVWME